MPLDPNNPSMVRYAVAFNLQDGYARNGCKDLAYQTHCMTPLYLITAFGLTLADRTRMHRDQSAPWHEQEETGGAHVERVFGTAPT